MSRVRTRFAPSPTGALHVGGVRTALFSYLFARHQGGDFVLRIEDTDRQRSDPAWTAEIIEAMQWLGLDWDEGPIFQSERSEVYARAIDKLLAAGVAYPCSCTPEELEEKRRAALASGGKAGYDRRCRPGFGPGPTAGLPTSIRFAMPLTGETVVQDLVRGPVVFPNEEIDDLVIARSDGTPTFNLVVTVDDAEMGITHVIRGDDHLANTAKQLHLYAALGASLPDFAHLPQVLGPDKARLSKRHGATAVLSYRDLGYYPDALVNFVARLGWSHGDQEVFDRKELISAFSLEGVGKAAGIFNLEKLDWLNFQYLKQRSPEQLAEDLREFSARRGRPLTQDPAWLARVALSLRERAHTLLELSDMARFYLEDTIEIDPKAAAKVLKPAAASILASTRVRLEALETWIEPALEASIGALAAEQGRKLGEIAQPLRVALTGGTASPGIFEVLAILGRERSLARVASAIEIARGAAPEPTKDGGVRGEPDRAPS